MAKDVITKDMTVAEAVKVNPDIMDILAKENIDFCCGGKHPLKEAVEAKGKDIDSFVAMLNQVEPVKESTRADAFKMSKAELVDYIIRHFHRPQLEQLDQIEMGLAKLLNVHYAHHHKELFDVYKRFMSIKAGLVPHFAQEEQDDFPRFLNGEAVDFSELVAEHEAVGEKLEALHEVTNNYQVPADGCNTYHYIFKLMGEFERSLHEHIFYENSILFLMK